MFLLTLCNMGKLKTFNVQLDRICLLWQDSLFQSWIAKKTQENDAVFVDNLVEKRPPDKRHLDLIIWDSQMFTF